MVKETVLFFYHEMEERHGKTNSCDRGRPNVGKSTLFNTLAGERISIVKDYPGVTRDRIYADMEWLGHSFSMIDTGGIEMDTKDMMLTYERTGRYRH